MIGGLNLTWQTGNTAGLTFTSDGVYDDFIKVRINGKDLDKNNYTVKEGRTIVTLKNEYIETLDSGTYTIDIVSKTGTATTTFTVKVPTTNNISIIPNTATK